jgi:hypothetical protein
MSQLLANPNLRIGKSGDGRWVVQQDDRLIHGPQSDAATARWVFDLYSLDVLATDPRWDEVGGKQLLSHRDCVRHDDSESPCAGAVEYRGPPKLMGRRSPLCKMHYSERADRRSASRRARSS